MSIEDINNIINKYVHDNLSPTQNQLDYISAKYEELRGFLQESCFKSGSLARYTANDPVHDLDVIHPVADATIQDDPSLVVETLYATLVEGYATSKTQINNIYMQSHSVTIEFADAPEEFSIDIVPAIELADLNEYGKPVYLVPEILLLNKHNRIERYKNTEKNPINWIRSDPRGYIKSASDLNNKNSDFRHSAKLLKAWRHACKMEYGDEFCLKSFHLEQLIHRSFSENLEILTVDAIIETLAEIPSGLTEPQIKDRADSERYIDAYVEDLTDKQKQLILRLQSIAFEFIRKLPGYQTEQEVINCLNGLLDVQKTKTFSFVPPIASPIIPRQPWSY